MSFGGGLRGFEVLENVVKGRGLGGSKLVS